YVVPTDPAPTPADLRAALADRLPPHMIPAAFVQLGALPLAPSGKVDVRALPAPDAEDRPVSAGFAPPQSELERRIAAVWQRVLGVPEVGVHDNFFELGGNSLLLAQVHRALQEEMGHKLALVDLFKHATVAALAKHLGGPDEDARKSELRIKDEAERRRAALRGRRDVAQRRVA